MYFKLEYMPIKNQMNLLYLYVSVNVYINIYIYNIHVYIIYIYTYVQPKLKKQNYTLVGKQFLNFSNEFKYKHLRNQWWIKQVRGRKGNGAGEEEEIEEVDEKYSWINSVMN